MHFLQTSNLTINPCNPEDCGDFIALESDPEVMRFLSGGKAVANVPSNPEEMFLRPRGTEPHVWTARRTGTGAFVGWFCLWPESGNVADLGYRLRREEWGKGLASEGASALINWGFNCAGYDKIIASTMAVNQASRRVLEKSGLIHMRTILVDWADAIPGGEQGEVHYEVSRLNWSRQAGRPNAPRCAV